MENNFNIKYPAVFAADCEESSVSFCPTISDALSKAAFCEDGVRKLFVIDSNVEKAFHELLFESTNKCAQEGAFRSPSLATPYSTVVIPSGERYKTMDSVLMIIEMAIKLGFNRNDKFVAIGGGVVCDMTAFAASIYKRGVGVDFVPTTLLAMVDAAIGGKTGCDHKAYKNMIGAFWPAKNIYYCTPFLRTLPNSEYLSGMAEAIKTALLYDADMVATFENNADKITARDPTLLTYIINRCAHAKASVVERDFRERGDRRMLNLGHTFAHALETYEGLGGLSHGCAVAWGITRAARLSQLLQLCDSIYSDRVTALMASYGYNTSATASHGEADFADKIIDAMHKDKKNTSDKVTFVLQEDICNNVIMEVSDNMIRQVL